MRDFTLVTYKALLQALQGAGYSFVTMRELCKRGNEKRLCCMRHDVDLKADHSLATAKIEHSLGIKAVYYFRVIPESNNPDIIREIVSMGHEIGYHYEDMSLFDGDREKAYGHFCKQLEYFRTYYPVSTICMHGAPTSRYDGRDLWKQYDYKSLGIECEPYLDLDYSHLLYLTDTGRRWDGYKVSLRDKIPVWQDKWIAEGLAFHTTPDIINALGDSNSPLAHHSGNILITTHPQRWTGNKAEWWREMLVQNIKNIVKAVIIRYS